MKIIPIQGLELADDLEVCTNIFTIREEIYREMFIFCSKENLKNYINEFDANIVLKKFRNDKVFVIFNPMPNVYTEFYNLKIALTEIYLANRYETRQDQTFFKRLRCTYGYLHKKNFIAPIECHIKIGTREFDCNDFDLTIPTYYTLDDYELSQRRYKFSSKSLKIETDIQPKLTQMSELIFSNLEISNKLRSALKLLYNTLTFTDYDSIIITYATIFETLLLKDNESNQRKKVALRLACILANNEKKEAKIYIASWISYFYFYRNKIVHDGVSASYIFKENIAVFQNTLKIAHNAIIDVIEIFIKNRYSSNDIKDIVKKNIEQDNIKNAFDYVTDYRNMIYEDEYDEELI